jgi:AraC-like DNA-binding protein
MISDGAEHTAGVNLASDPEAIGCVFPDTVLTQLSPGRVTARKDFILFDGLLCYRERWNQRMAGQASIPSSHFMLAANAEPRNDVVVLGEPLDRGALYVGRPTSELHFVTPRRSDHVVMLLPVAFAERLAAGAALGEPRGSVTIACSPEACAAFIRFARDVVRRGQADPGGLGSDAQRRALRTRLTNAVLACLHDRPESPGVGNPTSRRVVLRRALERAESLGWRVGAPELAAEAGVSTRALRLAFREGLGVPPGRFLRWRRLHGTNTDLLAANAGETTVQRIALD